MAGLSKVLAANFRHSRSYCVFRHPVSKSYAPEGKHLKYGIFKEGTIRYTKWELAGGRLRIIGHGSKEEMLEIERFLHENFPLGIEEGQKVYFRRQMERGMINPPRK